MHATDFELWLKSGVEEVVESMCFLALIGDAPVEASREDDPEWLACSLQFSGDPSGCFGVRAPWPTARLIAANFLGEDEQSLSEEQTVEVFCEVANISCGAILAHLKPKRTFSLSSPARDLLTSQSTSAADRIDSTFLLDEGILHAWLGIGQAV